MLVFLLLVFAAVVGGQRQLNPGSCNFESHTCGYTSDPDFTSWTLHSEGHFVAVDGDVDVFSDVSEAQVDSEDRGARGVLLSPVLELSEWSCLKLVYQISGEGTLDIQQRSEGQSYDWPLWSSTSPSDSWVIASVDLHNTTQPFRVVIEGSAVRAEGSSVAVFEIHISPGYCLECDFEESHLCGYTNLWNANVNWFVGGGAVQLLDNDFPNDHTFNNRTGHFMYVDSLHAVTFQEVAKLVSPMTTAAMSGCLSFQYQRSEERGNLFSVYTRDKLGQYQELWRAGPESRWAPGPGEWEPVQVDLKAPYSIQVVFEVAFNSPRGGRVAVDDISFSPEFCSADTEPNFDPSVGSCDFEEGLCEYVQGQGSPWRRVSVKPNIFRNGDHTTGAGSFLLAHSRLGPRSGYVSQLVGPNLPSNTKFCLRFYFSVRGFNQTEQALSVYLQDSTVQERIWTQCEKSRGIWIQGDVTFTTNGSAKVVFVSVCRSIWDCGSVALDDISLSLGDCELSKGLSVSVPGQCDFESGLCGYTQDKHSDDGDWQLRRGPTPTSYTGPRGDHTTGLGYYIHLEASPLLPGQRVRLRSRSLRGSRGLQCLHFYFHMYGSGTGHLSVSVDRGGDDQVLWERSGEQSMAWLRATVQYECDSQHQIVFEAMRGSSVRSDIAVDDIMLESGPCPEIDVRAVARSSNEIE